MCQKYKIDMDVRLTFQSFKLKTMLGTKDPLPLTSLWSTSLFAQDVVLAMWDVLPAI